MTKEFRVGVTVKLKSGGPSMSIKDVYPKSGRPAELMCRCQWFDDTKLATDDFPADSLELVAIKK